MIKCRLISANWMTRHKSSKKVYGNIAIVIKFEFNRLKNFVYRKWNDDWRMKMYVNRIYIYELI